MQKHCTGFFFKYYWVGFFIIFCDDGCKVNRNTGVTWLLLLDIAELLCGQCWSHFLVSLLERTVYQYNIWPTYTQSIVSTHRSFFSPSSHTFFLLLHHVFILFSVPTCENNDSFSFLHFHIIGLIQLCWYFPSNFHHASRCKLTKLKSITDSITNPDRRSHQIKWQRKIESAAVFWVGGSCALYSELIIHRDG